MSKDINIIKEYYPNGALMHEIPYKNDKIEGIVKIYYETGNLKNEISYKNGKKTDIIYKTLNKKIIQRFLFLIYYLRS